MGPAKTNEIRINAVGDIFLGDYTLTLGYGVASSIEKHGLEHNFRHVRNALRDADIVFGNLETVLSGAGKKAEDIRSVICRGEREYAGALKFAGFDVLNVANNHILQHGEEAFRETIETLKENGIAAVGVRGRGTYSSEPVFREIGGRRLALLGYSFVNENFHKGELLYARGGREAVLADIREARKEADHVAVSCHWGIEFVDFPSPNIRRLAREMADAGAAVVLGHHPHVPQGVERYEGSIIFYSLGNFLFDFLWYRYSRESMIATVRISDDTVGYELSPVRISDDCRVLPMEGGRRSSFLEHMESIAVTAEGDGGYDIEDRHYEYYVEADRKLMRAQRDKLFFILKNLHRSDPRFLKYMAAKSFGMLRRRQ